ncbi:MAG: T9SS type A sorting domain-containing protein [Bacteroidota bacterium]
MKHLFKTLLVLASLPAIAFSKPFELKQVDANALMDSYKKVPYLFKQDVPGIIKATPVNKQGSIYKALKNSQGNTLYGSWMFQEETEPIAYEPISNSYVLIGRDIIATEENQPFHLQSGVLYLISSQDNGNTWSTPQVIYQQPSHFDVMSTVSVFNPSGVSNPRDLHYFIYSRVAKAEDGQTSAPFYGGHFVFVTPEFTDAIALKGPVDNNPASRQKWFKTTAATYTKSGTNYSVLAGQLLPETGYPGGNYGRATVNMTEYDITSSIPQQWGIDKFRQASNPSSGSHYNNTIYIDADDEGTLYACVANMFIDMPEKRRVGFSISTNNGETWSDFEKMPISVLNDYITSQGANSDSAFIYPYEANGFVVYGKNKFSYFTRLYIIKGGDAISHIVEIKYDNGVWSVNKIHQLLNPPYAYGRMWAINTQKTSETGEEEIPFIYDRKYEISAGKTLDGYVFCKFLDHRNELITFPTTQIAFRQATDNDPYNYSMITWDTLPTNDVFVAYRQIASPQWRVSNVTNDSRYNRNTIVPKLVKSINAIPILHLRTDEQIVKRVSSTTQQPVYPEYYDYPSFLIELIDEIGMPAALEVAVVDAVNPNSVSDVKENNNDLLVYPNPASALTNVNFTIEKAGNATIKLSNALGQTLEVLANGYYNAGNFNVSLDASKYPMGSYYVTLTVDGHSVTKVMNIIK